VLEALSCGVPVVATDVGGIRDILVGELGHFILESVDAQAVKERILEAASRREEIKALCIARAGEFDSQKIFASLEDLYLSLTRTVPDEGQYADARRH
jgi:glycosyltransferase involved in cell wall biosynthesis